MKHDKTKTLLQSSPFSHERVLLLSRDIFTDSPAVAGLFGRMFFADDSHFFALGYVKEFIQKNRIDRIIFSNPYRHDWLTTIYKYCQTENFPMLVIERGCFPGTVFFDMDGFLLDSMNYQEKCWNIKPNSEQATTLEQFVSTYHNGLHALETQPERNGSPFNRLKSKSDTKPIIFITLQIPSDTVTRVFTNKGRSYADFIKFLGQAVNALGDKYHFVYKPHPRAPDLDIDGAIRLSDVHIDDAIENCDAVLTFNSGTGVLGFLHNKPVATYGRAFYSGQGLTKQIVEMSDLETFMNGLETSFDPEHRKRFLVHLLTNLLSEVTFMHLPFWKNRTAIAIQYRTIRIFDALTSQTCLLAFSQSDNLFSRAFSIFRGFSWAVLRWLRNRLIETRQK